MIWVDRDDSRIRKVDRSDSRERKVGNIKSSSTQAGDGYLIMCFSNVSISIVLGSASILPTEQGKTVFDKSTLSVC